MSAMKYLLSSLGLAAALCANTAAAVNLTPDIGYGTSVSASTAGNCPSFCTGNAFAGASDGAPGAVASSASESTYATARGSASFAAGSSYLPVLKGYGSAGLGKRAGSSSFASQQFTYTGVDVLHVALDVDLTATIASNPVGYASNTASANIAIVVADNIPWNPSFSSLIFEAVPQDAIRANEFVGIASTSINTASTTLSFDLNPGETFFVVSQLDVGAQNGTVDAEHTLVMAFDPVTAAAPGLVAATAPVPEPGSAWFLGLGLLALGWQARRAIPGR